MMEKNSYARPPPQTKQTNTHKKHRAFLGEENDTALIQRSFHKKDCIINSCYKTKIMTNLRKKLLIIAAAILPLLIYAGSGNSDYTPVFRNIEMRFTALIGSAFGNEITLPSGSVVLEPDHWDFENAYG